MNKEEKYMSKLRYIFRISLLKTIVLNFHYFGAKYFFKFPVIVARSVQFKTLKGQILLDDLKFGMIKIGFASLGTQNDSCAKGCIDISGKLIVHKSASFARGSSISVGKNGVLEIGSLVITGNTNLICMDNIKIGDDCLISWGGYLMDTDFHKIYDNSNRCNCDKPISIGNHVWIGMNCTILKGSVIPDECIVGAGSVITKKLIEDHSIYIDNQVVKRNITWEE